MLLDKYKLKVKYPHGGVHHVLVWNTRMHGSHLILARSERAVRSAFSAILEQWSGVMIQQYLCVDIVAPPMRWREEYARQHHRERIARVRAHILEQVQDLRVVEKHAPIAIVPCDRYEPSRSPDGSEPNDQEDMSAEHEECLRCGGAQRLPAIGTWEEFYAAHEAFFDEVLPPFQYDGTESQAPLPEPTDELWIAEGSFGPHSPGIRLRPADVPTFDETPDEIRYLFAELMFVCRNVSRHDFFELNAMIPLPPPPTPVPTYEQRRAEKLAREHERAEKAKVFLHKIGLLGDG